MHPEPRGRRESLITSIYPGRHSRPRPIRRQNRSGDGEIRISLAKVLDGAAALRHTSCRPLILGGCCSQGGVKFPTGGKGGQAQARERLVLPEIPWEKKGQQIR